MPPKSARAKVMSESNKSKITSRDNPRIKAARQIRDGRGKDKIFIEGLRLCEEVLASDLEISEVFYSENFAGGERQENFLEAIKNFHPAQVSENIFASLADTKTSQGIVVIAGKPQNGKERIHANLSEKIFPMVVLLHKINNPSNLGAILRTAEAVGATGIITTKNSADVFSAKSLRGSMGAAFRLPIWTDADFFDALEWAGELKLKSVCADVNSENSYTEIDWKTGILLVVGSEGHGLSQAERAATDESLIIPMDNAVESLNVAVATGVILFEAKRQQSK